MFSKHLWARPRSVPSSAKSGRDPLGNAPLQASDISHGAPTSLSSSDLEQDVDLAAARVGRPFAANVLADQLDPPLPHPNALRDALDEALKVCRAQSAHLLRGDVARGGLSSVGEFAKVERVVQN